MLNAVIQLDERGFGIHFPDDSLSRLKARCNLLVDAPIPDLVASPHKDALSRAQILMTGWGSKPVGKRELALMPELRLVVHLAGTVKPILSPEVMRAGIHVTHAAAVNARPVAQYVLAVILMHNKRVVQWARAYRERRGTLKVREDPMYPGIGSRGKVVGIVGASRVGRCLIDMLKPQGLRVLLHDPYLPASEAQALGVEPVTMDQLLRCSDVVSLHQPLLPSTRGSFGARDFAMMRDGALFVNTARGGIVDHDAMAAAMADGRLCAVLDVTEPEPLPDTSPLWDMDNVVITPHIAGSLGTEVADMTDEMIAEIDRFTRGEALRHELAADMWERVA